MNAEQAKFLTDIFANLIEQESATTARVLASVPDSGRDYRPDAKSRTAWDLATHLATADVWFLQSIIDGKFEWNPDAATAASSQFHKVSDVVEFYRREMGAKLKALRALPNDQLARTVDFFGMMQQPAAQLLGLANNHGIHHRGQLAAYLRAAGSTVPSIYGGSADEPLTAAT